MTHQPETLLEALKVLATCRKDLEQATKFGKWRSLPNMPTLEIREDGGAVRIVREVPPQKDGYTVAQVEGVRVRARLCDLHRAAWPNLYPSGAAPATPVRPKRVGRPFQGIEQAPGTRE